MSTDHQDHSNGSRLKPVSAELRTFFSQMEESLAEGLVPARILNDPELYELERERLFARVWTFIGHESEIPSPGDYALRYIGEDAFIFVRDEEGGIRVLFNACRHRGTQVCRAEKGNASHFRCPYHGWVYKNTGDLVGMPSSRETAEGLDRSRWGLLSAPRVDSYRGLVFACLDPDAPSLEDYLGGMKYYLDMLFVLNDDLEVVGEAQRWDMAANWKSGAENFGGDDYHLIYLHRSMFEVGVIQIPFHANMLGNHIQPGNGHALAVSIAEDPETLAFWGFPEEITSRYDSTGLSPAQYDIAKRSRVLVSTVFPNFSVLAIPLTGNPHTEKPTTFVMLRLWQPSGPGRMQIWNWMMVPKSASPEFREASFRAGMGTFASSGLFDQDDAEPWQSMARTGGSTFARKTGFKLNYQQGLSIGTAKPVEDWPGPGVVFDHRYEEGVQRTIYERWLQYMQSDTYPEPLVPSLPLDPRSRNGRKASA
jgi:phenylpropionate dioxygenase-like ring-hydroxylating dioxygenase large terminal subunit